MTHEGQYGEATTFSFPLVTVASQDYQAAPAIAVGDAKVSIDGGAEADAANLPVVSPAGGTTVEWTASAAEMQGKRIVLTMIDVAGAQWEQQKIVVYTRGHASAHVPLDQSATLKVDVGALGGDAAALANLLKMFNGAGYFDPVGPALQQQLDQINVVGSADNKPASGMVLTTGNEVANTYLATEALDQVYNTFNDDGGVLEFEYEFFIGANGSPNGGQWTGYLQSSNDNVTIKAWDWVSETWKQVESITGTNPVTPQTIGFKMFTTYVGVAGNAGKVRLQFAGTGLTSAVLATDQVLVSFANNNESVGYARGAVWVDTVDGFTGVVPYVNGVADHASSDFSEALTIGTAVPLKVFEVAPGSEITLASSFEGKVIRGTGWTLNLGGQSISGSTIEGAHVTGTATGTEATFVRCDLTGVPNLPPCCYTECKLEGDLILGGSGSYVLERCVSAVAGNDTPSVDFVLGGGAVFLSQRGYSGGTRYKNVEAGDKISLEGDGQYILDETCTGGDLSPRGNFKETDEAEGRVTIDGAARVAVDTIRDAILDDATRFSGASIAAILAASGGTSGSVAITVTVKDQDSNPVVGVALDVFDAGGTVFQGRETTNAAGQAVLNMNPGSWGVRQTAYLYTADNVLEALTVVAATPAAVIYTGTRWTPAAAVNPLQCKIEGYLRDGNGALGAGEQIFFRTVVPQSDGGAIQYAGALVAITTDADGFFSIDWDRNIQVEVSSTLIGFNRTVKTVPNAGSQNFATW